MNKPSSETDNGSYSRASIAAAACLFFGFVLIVYFLPQIMAFVGGENRIVAAGVIVAVLFVPFVGLWLRGRAQNKR